MQLSDKNKDMEILIDTNARKTVKLIDVIQGWREWERCNSGCLSKQILCQTS